MTPDQHEAEFTEKCKQELAKIRAEVPPCEAPCYPCVCDDCPCRDPLEYLQTKSDQADPVKAPQYERD